MWSPARGPARCLLRVCVSWQGRAARTANRKARANILRYRPRHSILPTAMNSETLSATPPSTLVIASRESRLAMWQAEHVRCALHKLYPSCDVKILGMTTRGDQILDRTLSKVGGKGLV